jgi:regulator of replication initiation timing
MRYELNFDEDKIIDIEAIGDNGVLDLNDCCKIMNEQQATIRKLQDLCGQSDGENARLRIENKMLEKEIKLLKPTNIEQYEQIVQLQKENEKLRKELGDCEKFRYTVFKRLNDEYIKERSIK